MKKLVLAILCAMAFSLGAKAQNPTKIFEIQSILVDACNFSSPEEDNEMFTFKVGPNPINSANLILYGWQGNTGTTYTVNNWPSLNVTWNGVIQNVATGSVTAALQATISNGCGKLIEPPGGNIPAYASVLVVSSMNPSTTDNSFAALTDTLYIIYHNSTGGTAHFKNSYCVGSALSTIPCVFTSTTTATASRGMILKDNASGKSDTVTYKINLLTNTLTATPYGGSSAQNDGATVEFAWPGFPTTTYINNGCKAPFIPLSANASPTNTTICSNGSVSLNGTAGGTYTSTVWSGGTGVFGNANSLNTTYTPGVGESGTIVLTLTVYGKCSGATATSGVAVTINPAPTPTITSSNGAAVCNGSSTVLTASGSGTYTWNPGAHVGATYTVSPASTQIYTVAATNTCGTSDGTFTVTVNSNPVISVNNPSTCAGQAVTLQANPTTLTSYTWTGVSSSTSTASVAPSSTASYTVSATDANGCVSNAAVSTVSVTAGTQISVTSSNNLPCITSTYTLTANGATTYTWVASTGTFSSLDANNTQISVTQGTAAVTFSVSGVGSCPATPTVVTINPAPANSLTITATPSNAVVCAGNSATLTASGASTYTWTPNITNGVSFTPASSQIYSVTGTDGNGCKGFDTVSVVVNQNPILSVTSQTICPSATATLTAMPTTLTSYTWSTGSLADTTIVSPSVNSVYNVSATDANGCVGTATASINIVNNLTVSVLVTNSLPCSGSLDTLIAWGAQSYTWTASSGSTTSISADNSTVTINPTTATTYSVKGSSGTCLDSTTITVNIAPPINISVTSNPANATICVGDNITLSGSGASTYTWTGGVIDNTAFTPVSSQTYTVTGTDANGCTGIATQSVTVNSLPTINVNASSSAICVGQSATLTASGANTYTWSTTETTPVISVSPSNTQTYTVIGTDGNSCTNATSPFVVTVAVNQLPTITINSNPAGSAVCFGSTATLTASGASTYTWDSGSNNNPINVNPTIQTTYTVVGTDANNCLNFSTITISVNPLPVAQTITASSPVVCIGAINPPVVLSAPNAGTWIGPAPSTATISANSTSISVTQGGIYTLVTTNGCGNAPSAPYTLAADSVIANFIASPLVGQMPVTVNYTNTSTGLAGNTLSYSWNFGDGSSVTPVTNPTEIFTNAGTYQTTLTTTDNLGCKDTATVYIVVNVIPPVLVIPNIFTPNIDGINDVFTVDATGINNFDCKIYDRWGLLLHEWAGVNGGWDGKAKNGANCTDGTYFYLITYTDNYNKSSKKEGFFQLIR